MTNDYSRDYNCKDEELPVICNFGAFSLNRDLSDFTDYSKKFNADYVAGFKTTIASATEVVAPESELLIQKAITARLYAMFDSLIDPINRVAGYLSLAKLGITPDEFGLTRLRKCINSRDAEGAMDSLHTVISNIENNNDALVAQGLSDELIARFTTASSSIAADKQLQYEIGSKRKNIVQDNLALFNGLYQQLVEVLDTGKILYKSSNPAKLQEYTFSELKKRVRKAAKPSTTGDSGKKKDDDTTAK